MCSPGSTSNALLVKDEEENEQDVLPVPKLHRDAVADAMDMDLTDWVEQVEHHRRGSAGH